MSMSRATLLVPTCGSKSPFFWKQISVNRSEVSMISCRSASVSGVMSPPAK